MANKAGKLGTLEIRDAKELFEKSCKVGRPDFRYAAIAIGKNPLMPPKWAIEACINERRRTERISVFKAPDKHNEILDQMAVLLIEHDLGTPTPVGAKQFKSVRGLLREAAIMLGYADEGTSDDRLRSLERKWTTEQKLAGNCAARIGSQRITPRIERIKDKLFGEEFGVSKDPAVDAYWEYRKQVMRDPFVGNTDID